MSETMHGTGTTIADAPRHADAPLDARRSTRDAPATPPTREGYERIPLYSPGTAPCATDVSDTINLWGAPAAAVAAVRASTVETLAHYPALYNATLKAPIAAFAGVAAEEVVTG